MDTKGISSVIKQREREPNHSLFLVLISILLGDLFPNYLPALIVPLPIIDIDYRVMSDIGHCCSQCRSDLHLTPA